MSVSAAGRKVGTKDPAWLRAAIGDTIWRLTWALLAGLAVSIGFGYALQAIGVSDIPWSLLIGLPSILVFIWGTGYAYRRGVRDGRVHPSDSDA